MSEPEQKISVQSDNACIRQEEPMFSYSVRLTSWHARQARKIGEANLSRGIRRAIEQICCAKQKGQ